LKSAALLAAGAAGVFLLAGCGHKQVAYAPPPPPSPYPQGANASGGVPYETFPPSGARAGETSGPAAANGAVADSAADLRFVETHRPIWTETGLASWYGPPYDRHRGANGEIYDQNMLSAADRVLPLDSLVRVTNVRTGQSAIMRVTDRGPFVPGRVLDLSKASAKAVGVYLPGTAEVRIEAFYAPKPIAEGGRWCVQIGAFHSKHDAVKLQEKLQRQYAGANVIEFTGPTGDWVRIRPQGDNREQAEAIEQSVQPKEGAAYLTRLD
jgi:rare lipoprotein A